MKIVISGGTGLIGKPLVQKLLGKGHEVTVLSRSRQADLDDRGLRFVQWDGVTQGPWSAFVEGADAVIHLAGEGIAEGRWSSEKKRRILQSRTQSTEALVSAVKAASSRPNVFLQGSAVGWYGPTDHAVDETAGPGSDFLAKVCRAWESSSAPLDAMAIRRPVLRTGVVLSLDGGAFPKMVLPIRFGAGGPLGSGTQWFPWIHIQDEVAAIVHLLEHESASGPFNLTAPGAETNKAITKVIGRVLKRPTFMPAPSFALKLALGEMSVLLLEGQKAVPKALLDTGFRFDFPDAESAVADLLG